MFVITQSSREQLAIAEFAKSLLIIPKQLAVNAAQDSTDLVAKLRAFHNTSQKQADRRDLKWLVCYFRLWKIKTKILINIWMYLFGFFLAVWSNLIYKLV